MTSRCGILFVSLSTDVRSLDNIIAIRRYNADDLWCGLAGSNYSKPLTNIGSEADWHTFIDAAHARNIAVTSFWNAAYFWTGQCPKSPLATENLLENTDGELRPVQFFSRGGWGLEHPISVLSGRRPATPSIYADARCIILMPSLFQRLA